MEYKKFHDSFLTSARQEGYIHGDHIHPVLLLWIEFDEESKIKFLDFMENTDPEFKEEMEEYLENYDIKTNIIPVYFPMHFHEDSEYDAFMNFIDEIKSMVNIHVYSLLSEISIHEDDEDTESEDFDEENVDYYPGIFTETKDSQAFFTVMDYSGKVLEDYSGEYSIDDPFIEGLRMDIF